MQNTLDNYQGFSKGKITRYHMDTRILWLLYGVYFAAAFFIWRKRMRIFGIGFNPLGFTVTYFNSFFRVLGYHLRGFWNVFGAASYFVYGNIMLLLFPALFIGISGYFLNIPLIVSAINTTFSFLALSIDFPISTLYFFVIVVLSIAIHEFFHGILAGAKGIPVKSVGLVFIPQIIYGAFVYIDYTKYLHPQQQSQVLKPDHMYLPIYPFMPPQIKYLIDGDGEVVEQEIPYQAPRSSNPITSFSGIERQESSFVIKDAKLRRDISHIQASGLFSNLVLAFVARYLLVYYSSLLWVSSYSDIIFQVYNINVILILFNLIPVVITDGGKILLNKVQDLFSDQRGAALVRFIVNLQGNLLFYLLIFYLIAAIF